MILRVRSAAFSLSLPRRWLSTTESGSTAPSVRVLDPSQMTSRSKYQLMTSAITPRPIAMVSTVSAHGIPNVAPFSYFNMFSHDPPVVGFSVSPNSDGSVKDTLRNALLHGQFTISAVTEPILEQCHKTSANYPYETSEFDAADLTPLPCEVIRPPRIGESPFSMECIVTLTHNIMRKREPGTPSEGKDSNNDISTTLVLGEVVRFHIADECLLADFSINFAHYPIISRLNKTWYGTSSHAYSLARPKLNDLSKVTISVPLSSSSSDLISK